MISRRMWALIFVIAMGLLFSSIPFVFGQDILNPPTFVYKLQWQHDGADTEHYDVRFTANGPWLNIGKPLPRQVFLPELTPGNYLVDVRACAPIVPPDTTPICTSADKALPLIVVAATIPAVWTNRDVGPVGLNGSAAYGAAKGLFTLRGDGPDVYGVSDAFRYVSQPLPASGGVIVARLVSIENTARWAKAGLMMRASDAHDAPHVYLNLQPKKAYQFLSRLTNGGGTIDPGVGAANGNWMKLSREGDVVTGFLSPDGQTWTRVGSATVPGLTMVGLAVSSQTDNPAVLNTSTFDSVVVGQDELRPPAPPTLPEFTIVP